MTSFWSWYIILIVLGVTFGTAALLYFVHRIDTGDIKEGESMGHSFDGIEELNNPLPKWWHIMFWITIVYSLAYLALYPGLGSYPGLLGWTSTGQWETEMQKADDTYGPIYEKMAATPINELAGNQEALKMGQRLFANNCTVCHGSDARGARGYPDLTDQDWLYGSTPARIKQSIMMGRSGFMPALGEALGDKQTVTELAHYVRSLNGYQTDTHAAENGKKTFKVFCTSCHGTDAKGNQFIGAPDLTDGVWLYGGSQKIIENTIAKGRSGSMPAHKELLGEEKVHILAAYIYSFAKKPL